MESIPYVINLKIDDSTEKILHDIKKALDGIDKTDLWRIEIIGGGGLSPAVLVNAKKNK